MRFEEITNKTIMDAARIHSESWKESRRSFCSAEFVERHTVEAQAAYLRREQDAGKRVFMLIDDSPVGIISVHGDLIENLYVLPSRQNQGYGTLLLRFAARQCYRIEEKPALLLTGYKRRFTGSPNDKQDQDHSFACETRLEQYILEGICREHENTYQILTNFDTDGYDFYFAYQFPKWALEDMQEIPADIAARFENVPIPAGEYIIFETERCEFPTAKMDELRKKAISEWLPTSGYELRNAPEIGVIHWYWEEGNEKLNNSRYCELWLPIAKK